MNKNDSKRCFQLPSPTKGRKERKSRKACTRIQVTADIKPPAFFEACHLLEEEGQERGLREIFFYVVLCTYVP